MVVISKGQPLDVIEQVVAQSQDDPFGGASRHLAAEKGKRPLDDGQPHKAQTDGIKWHRSLFRRGNDGLIDKVAQQQIGNCFSAGGDHQAEDRP